MDIDYTVLEQMKTLLKDQFPLMASQFLSTGEDYLSAIQTALEQGNAQHVAEAAHPLKSSSASLGFSSLAENAQALESKAYEVQDGEGNIDDLRALAAAVAEAFVMAQSVLEKEI